MSQEFLPDPSQSNTSHSTPRSHTPPNLESIRHVLYGSQAAIARTISILHLRGYAEPFQWSRSMPTKNPGEYMSILSRQIKLE